MAVKQLTHTGKQLDEAISRVQGNYADVSGTDAQTSDVRLGKKFVGADKKLKVGTLVPGEAGEPEHVTVTPSYEEQIITPSMGHYISRVTVKAVKPRPQEISTAAEMDALQAEDNVGCIYKYTGTTTSSYTNGGVYIVVDDSNDESWL